MEKALHIWILLIIIDVYHCFLFFVFKREVFAFIYINAKLHIFNLNLKIFNALIGNVGESGNERKKSYPAR